MQLQNQFKIRCSAIGQIMTDPKTKADKDTGKLSKTCLTYVYEWIKSQPEFYGKSVNFSSKYTTKGNLCEADSIEFAAKYYGWGKVKKNEIEFNDHPFLKGTPDVILPESIEDIKNSWSQKTFPLFEKEIPVDGYGWQLQGYMEMQSKPQAGLIYTLMDAPEKMIDKEARNRAYELGLDEVDVELWDEVKQSMSYSQYPDELRIKRYFLDRDKECMGFVEERVDRIRKFISEL